MARIFLNIILCTMLCSFCLARGFTEENLCDSLRFLLWDRSTSFLYDLLNCNSMLSTCGTSASRHRDNCGPYPWVVSLRKRSTREHECVGTFVDNRNIITAASCFKNRKSFKDIEVGYGSQHTGYLDYSDIRSVTFHPKYNPKTSMNDIAIVTIQRKVDNRKSPCVQPICLPGKIGYSSSGDTVTIAGWGYSSKFPSYKKLRPGTLQSTSIDVVKEISCRLQFTHVTSWANMMCAGNWRRNEFLCHGYTGAPVMTRKGNKWMLQAISTKKSDCENPSLFTNIPRYVPWINRVVKRGNSGR